MDLYISVSIYWALQIGGRTLMTSDIRLCWEHPQGLLWYVDEYIHGWSVLWLVIRIVISTVCVGLWSITGSVIWLQSITWRVISDIGGGLDYITRSVISYLCVRVWGYNIITRTEDCDIWNVISYRTCLYRTVAWVIYKGPHEGLCRYDLHGAWDWRISLGGWFLI